MARLTKFKVGDKVRGTNCDIKGYEGIIERITSAGYVIRLTTNGRWSPNAGWCKGDICGTTSFWDSCLGGLELVEETPLMGMSADGYCQVVNFGWDTALDEAVVNGYIGKGGDFEVYQQPKIKNKTIMNKITTFAKNLTLSADEKALRKVGLKTECGDYTQAAIDVVLQDMCAEREARLVEIANGIISEEAK